MFFLLIFKALEKLSPIFFAPDSMPLIEVGNVMERSDHIDIYVAFKWPSRLLLKTLPYYSSTYVVIELIL